MVALSMLFQVCKLVEAMPTLTQFAFAGLPYQGRYALSSMVGLPKKRQAQGSQAKGASRGDLTKTNKVLGFKAM